MDLPTGFQNPIGISFKCILFLFAFHPALSGRILVMPHQSSSHARYFVQVSEPLLKSGHEVYGVMNGACKDTVKMMEKVGIKIIPYYLEDNSCFTETPESGDFALAVFNKKENQGDQKKLLVDFSATSLINVDAMMSDEYVDKIRKLNFDLCINDGFALTLYTYILPYKLDLPYISLTSGFFPTLMGVPGLPSFTPGLLTLFTDKMSFMERFENTIMTVLSQRLILDLPGSQDYLVVKYAPEKPQVSLYDLYRRSKLWMLNTDLVLDYPRVSLPHIVNVGGLSTRPAKPLPDDLQIIMDQSKNGVIFLSFGSIVKKLPVDVTKKIIKALKQFKEYTVIMKYNGPKRNDIPSNMKLLTWLPQNDILAHPSVKVFITHCGNNGQFEGLYHGVPLLGMPIYGDQPYNSKRMAAKNFGVIMKITDFTSEELVANIKEILNNSTYTENIKKASRIFRSRKQSPTERAAFWVEHVMDFGAEHLLSEATRLPWYQFWLVDIAAFIFGILVVGFLVFGLILRFSITFLCSGRTKVKIN